MVLPLTKKICDKVVVSFHHGDTQVVPVDSTASVSQDYLKFLYFVYWEGILLHVSQF